MEFNFTIIGQMITFALLVICTMKYVWPPVLQAMQERAEKIADGLAAAEQGKQALEDARQQVEEILREGRVQVNDMLDQASKRAAAIVDEARHDAREEAAKIREQAENDVNQLLVSARNSLKNETAGLALAIAERIIGRHIDEAANSNLIDQALNDAGKD